MLKATLIGNLGNDPEMRYSAQGTPFLRFNVASNFRVRNPEGEWQDKTEWVRVTVTGQRAESLSNMLKKGQRVYVDGRLEARPWSDQQGQMRAGLEVMANEVQFLSPRTEGDAQAPAPDQGRADCLTRGAQQRTGYPSRGPASAQNVARQASRQATPPPADDDLLEDLPF